MRILSKVLKNFFTVNNIGFRVLKKYFSEGEMPSKNYIIDIMKKSDLNDINSDETFKRRSSTIKSWINWIVGWIND